MVPLPKPKSRVSIPSAMEHAPVVDAPARAILGGVIDARSMSMDAMPGTLDAKIGLMKG